MSGEKRFTVTVLRSNDGVKVEIPVSSSTSLTALKRMIYKKLEVMPKYQRIFFLGRELKSGQRSLDSLGFGKFGVRVIHLMSNQPKVNDLSSGSTSRERSKSSRKAINKEPDSVIVLDESPARAAPSNRNESEVIEILNDDNDDIRVRRTRRRKENQTIDLS